VESGFICSAPAARHESQSHWHSRRKRNKSPLPPFLKMGSRMKKLSIIASTLVTVLTATDGVNAALVPLGGKLTAESRGNVGSSVGFTTAVDQPPDVLLGTSYGPFGIMASVNVCGNFGTVQVCNPSHIDIEGEIVPERLTLNVNSLNSGGLGSADSSGSAQVNFNLPEPGEWRIQAALDGIHAAAPVSLF
jgi:hypothetical protein